MASVSGRNASRLQGIAWSWRGPLECWRLARPLHLRDALRFVCSIAPGGSCRGVLGRARRRIFCPTSCPRVLRLWPQEMKRQAASSSEQTHALKRHALSLPGGCMQAAGWPSGCMGFPAFSAPPFPCPPLPMLWMAGACWRGAPPMMPPPFPFPSCYPPQHLAQMQAQWQWPAAVMHAQAARCSTPTPATGAPATSNLHHSVQGSEAQPVCTSTALGSCATTTAAACAAPHHPTKVAAVHNTSFDAHATNTTVCSSMSTDTDADFESFIDEFLLSRSSTYDSVSTSACACV